MVPVALLTRVCIPHELHFQDLLGVKTCLPVGSYDGVLFYLLQNILKFVYGIKIGNLVAGNLFKSVLALLAMRRAETMSWLVEKCHKWYQEEF